MEMFMKTLCSVIALAVTLAMAGTWPSVVGAQSKQTTERKAVNAKQKPARHVARAVSASETARPPCVRHVWYGCAGWDPDPNVRDMLARDVGDDD
jgi:hypothetical protein